MENRTEQTNEEYYAGVMSNDKYLIAILAYFEGKYYFRYNKPELEKMQEETNEQVRGILAFPELENLYISPNSLFSFFKDRVSQANKETPKAVEELIETKGRSLTDTISIMKVPDEYKPSIKARIKEEEERQLLEEQFEVTV